MKKLLFTLFLFLSTILPAQAPSPAAITDPAQIISKQKFDVQPFIIEKLYMTRGIAYTAWWPDDRQIALVTTITGRYNIWLAHSQGGWPTQLTVSNDRPINIAWWPKGRWMACKSDYGGYEQWDRF